MNNVQKLMQGTANLNQMRTEIKMVVNTIRSLLLDPGTSMLTRVQENDPPKPYWVIEFKGQIAITCMQTGVGVLYYNSGHKKNPEMDVANVKAVHESLESFVVWMLECFPELNEKLEPIFVYAEP